MVAGVLACAGLGLAVRMLQPLPSVPPAAPAGGVLARITVPGVGPAWVELGEPGPHQSRQALAVRSIHPQVRFFPDLAQAGRAWGVYRVHTPETKQEREAELRWDGQVFRYRAEPFRGKRAIEVISEQAADRGSRRVYRLCIVEKH